MLVYHGHQDYRDADVNAGEHDAGEEWRDGSDQVEQDGVFQPAAGEP